MYKWLTIMGIVCIGFIVVLLSLGYLLKENEATTFALKQKLEQEKIRTSSEETGTKAVLSFVGNNIENNDLLKQQLAQQKKIIVSNLTCTSSQQCQVVQLNQPGLGCVVSINSIGASLLNKSIQAFSKEVDGVDSACTINTHVKSMCKQNICELVE